MKKKNTTRRSKKRVAARKVKQVNIARDVEVVYSRAQFVAKLRRFATAVARGKGFKIQIAGKRLNVPKTAKFTIEHESSGKAHEIEFQTRW